MSLGKEEGERRSCTTRSAMAVTVKVACNDVVGSSKEALECVDREISDSHLKFKTPRDV